MPKINEKLKLMLEAHTDEEITEEELEAIETGLNGEQQEELQQALQDIFDERDEFSSKVDKAHVTLTKFIIDLAAPKEEEEEEEEKPGEEKKVKKAHDWGFTLVPHSED